MSLQRKYLEILALLAPVGAVGVPLTVGSATMARESEEAVAVERGAIPPERVSERLAAIREAVSAVAAASQSSATTPPYRLAQVPPAPFQQGPHWTNFFHYNPYYSQPWGNGWGNWHFSRVCRWAPIGAPVCYVVRVPN